MLPAIKTLGLTKAFGDMTAVDGLDLQVEAGILFGFLGPNGAGKSTTIKMLAGLLAPTCGRAEILGRDTEREAVEVKRRIGVVPEESALFERLTGPEYLRFVGRMYGMPRPLIDERSAEVMELMGLADDRGKLIVDYSHGMRKKLALCAAVIHEPRVLFLDEPFEGIDAVSSKLVRSILHQLVGSGVTIFLTSHILEIVEKLCSHVAIIHQGRLVAQGPLGDLRAGAEGPDGEAGNRSLEALFLSLVGGEGAAEGSLSWLE